MDDEIILLNWIEDFFKQNISISIFVKYYRDIFDFLIREEEIEERRYYLYKELHEYLESYDFISNTIAEYYYLDENDVRVKVSEMYSRILN
ncbi:hypothetical protein BFS35_004375 [Macrococcoides goetzii]|uniref:Uncharacterized protein n=1 Tax=Macrococcoides goetzii TaxID=1891097 RepID=A0A2G5NRR6_9STAP|nr:hypothetical protein [Macrococcus goetzii]RAI82929.1 hypothetical protein BFS35_004375 [Macrococcus goetzii]